MIAYLQPRPRKRARPAFFDSPARALRLIPSLHMKRPVVKVTTRAEKRALIRQLIASLEQVAQARGQPAPVAANDAPAVGSNIIQFPVPAR